MNHREKDFNTLKRGVFKPQNYDKDFCAINNSIGKAVYCYNLLYKYYQAQIGNYFRLLYQIILFVENSNLKKEEKENYVRIVRAQLSNDELFLLFYNCLSNWGVKFKPLIEKYHLFNNLPLNSLIDKKEHIKEYSLSAYGKNLSEYPMNDENLND